MDYTVKPGDTLSKIARDRLGNMELWKEIAIRNGIGAPYTIEVGQVLRLTDDHPATAVRRVQPGLTITAPVPVNARRPMPIWQRVLLWGGVIGITAMFIFPPSEGAFASKSRKRAPRGRTARA